MSDLTSQVRNTTAAVEEVAVLLKKNQLEAQRHVKLLEQGVLNIEKALQSQTETLGELETIRAVSELQALNELISTEENMILQESEEDSAEIGDLDQMFERLRLDIEAKRNRQVAELFQDNLYTLWDRDLAKLEDLTSSISPLMAEFVDVTSRQVEERRDAIHEGVDRVTRRVEALEEQRQGVKDAVREIQNDPRDPSNAKEAILAIPFFVLEIEDSDGLVTLELVPPSEQLEDPDHLFGFDLQPLHGIAQLADRLRGMLGSLMLRLSEGAPVRERTVEDLATPVAAPSGLKAWAWNMLRRALMGREYSELAVASDSGSLSEVRHAYVGSSGSEAGAPLAETGSAEAPEVPEISADAEEAPPEDTAIWKAHGDSFVATSWGVADTETAEPQPTAAAEESSETTFSPWGTTPVEPDLEAEPSVEESVTPPDHSGQDELLEDAISFVEKGEFREALTLLDFLAPGGARDPEVIRSRRQISR